MTPSVETTSLTSASFEDLVREMLIRLGEDPARGVGKGPGRSVAGPRLPHFTTAAFQGREPVRFQIRGAGEGALVPLGAGLVVAIAGARIADHQRLDHFRMG